MIHDVITGTHSKYKSSCTISADTDDFLVLHIKETFSISRQSSDEMNTCDCDDAVTIMRHQCCDILLIQKAKSDGEQLW